MFSPAKFVIIDNDKIHLSAVANAIGDLGAGCRMIHYTAEDGAGEVPLKGVRIVFTDLHLSHTAAATTDNAHYAAIAGILEELVPLESGPYVVCLWTRHPDELEAFREYIYTRMGAEGEVNRPLIIFSLNKIDYIELDSGNSLENTNLSDDIIEKLVDVPQLCALMGFENDVIQATDATLSKIRGHASLINPDEVHSGLDLLLNHLGDAAVGNSNLHNDVRRAIHSSIFPLIADEAINSVQTDIMKTAWANSVSVREQLEPLDLRRSSELTYSIHATIDHEPDPANWGMVSRPTEEQLTGQFFTDKFGLSAADFLEREVRLNEDYRQTDKIRFIRAGASCDYAQQKEGPIQCVLGVEAIESQFSRNNWKQKKSWRSPFISARGGEIYQLWFFPFFNFSATATEIATWDPQYRLRTDILMELTNKVSAHHARPGIARFMQ